MVGGGIVGAACEHLHLGYALGFVGSLLDSLLGAWLQPPGATHHALRNSFVNLLSASLTMGVGVLCTRYESLLFGVLLFAPYVLLYLLPGHSLPSTLTTLAIALWLPLDLVGLTAAHTTLLSTLVLVSHAILGLSETYHRAKASDSAALVESMAHTVGINAPLAPSPLRHAVEARMQQLSAALEMERELRLHSASTPTAPASTPSTPSKH